MIIAVTLFWLIASIFTFRYTGYAKPRTVKAQYAYCPWPFICSFCKCINCTEDLSSHHSGWHSSCDDYSPTRRHTSEYVLAVAFAFLWPVHWMVWAIKQVPSRTGFFLPPPEIKSRENKLSERLEELELENARLEKEAGLYEHQES